MMEDYYQVYDRIRRSGPSVRGEKSQKEKTEKTNSSFSDNKSDSLNIRDSRIITHLQQWQLLEFMKMSDKNVHSCNKISSLYGRALSRTWITETYCLVTVARIAILFQGSDYA